MSLGNAGADLPALAILVPTVMAALFLVCRVRAAGSIL